MDSARLEWFRPQNQSNDMNIILYNQNVFEYVCNEISWQRRESQVQDSRSKMKTHKGTRIYANFSVDHEFKANTEFFKTDLELMCISIPGSRINVFLDSRI